MLPNLKAFSFLSKTLSAKLFFMLYISQSIDNCHFFCIPAIVITWIEFQKILRLFMSTIIIFIFLYHCLELHKFLVNLFIRSIHVESQTGLNNGIVFSVDYYIIFIINLTLLMSISFEQEINIVKIKTQPFTDQKPGTSGLRKKVSVFEQKNYTQNFIQSIFNSLRKDALSPKNTLLVGGDGRYFTKEAIQIICQIACANGVDELHIAKNGLMSTPACSVYIRNLNQVYGNCLGGVLLTASHNPGGKTQDFGIKFNSRNGGPAQQQFTNSIFAQSQALQEYKITNIKFLDKIDISKLGEYNFKNVLRPSKQNFTVKVVENVQHYVDMMKSQFNFESIQALLNRKDFKAVFDGMHGAAGPYAESIFVKQLGDKVKLINCVPLEDFKGQHPDPNLKCAKQLVQTMGINTKDSTFDFGASCDGDADRNMILGKNFFVTPSDSLAVLASKSHLFLKNKLKGVARSMPTSGAVDKVVKKLGIQLYETPTGWKYFGNLMEDDLIGLCGEESFGTGSPHIRQKDGLWTILAWLQIIAIENKDTKQGSLNGIQQIVQNFWSQYGRNYYCRYDFQNCNIEKGNEVWNYLLQQVKKYKEGNIIGSIFEYSDPVDQTFSPNQGLIFKYSNGSRVIFRKSGTGAVGMTIRIYFQKYQEKEVFHNQFDILKDMINFGLELSQIREFTGKTNPDVIT